ncbi:hypothetical protein POJ06DRAFT_258959 [Lipomyces tetrasporus]|uniref:THIF-type NAD/FAD binding fold domain-containing protein n=1 Tax=Lipomyces tetrasporus TaxID=54092 RepID=A0AAD7QN49_9ASCO|nr:uncharacterized protein POJ06DRAFT_258959 [Lipomyces tetrasporus]KAJ8098249.1 hypothetical protein POJ06DRAFT_258959 [Lipomyces tetrasporus]
MSSQALIPTTQRKFFLLAATALAATSAFSVLCTLTVQSYQRSRRLAELKASIDVGDPTPSVSRRTSVDDHSSESSRKKTLRVTKLNELGVPASHSLAPISESGTKFEWDPDLIDEQLARNRVFLGDEGLQKVRNAFVIVVGCGGVGSWIVAMLVRSGIGKLRIIDFDQVTLSSLNRHASATLEDVGTPKVESLRKYLSKVAPWVEIETKVELWHKDSADRLLEGRPTYVVDAIDNIDTKVDLLEYCYNNGLPVISAMGAGCKADPTRIQIDDISGSAEDPLARATRRRLRLKGITTGITVVFSSEKPGSEKASLLPLDEDVFKQGKVNELGVLQDFRARILPVLGTMPGIFGLAISTHILTHIGGYPIDEYIVGRNRVKTYDSVLHHLAGQKMRLEGSQKLPLDTEDIGYLVEEVFRGRSVVSRESGGSRIALTKWHLEDGWTAQNIVLMTKEEAKRHEARVLKGGEKVENVYPQAVIDLVRRRLEEEKVYSRFRE